MTSGYVYVILLRECISQELHIFKIGRTTDIFTRYKAYPKGSKLLLLHYVDNCVQAEKDIIQSLKSSTLTQKTEYGSEYFEGSFIDLLQIVCQCSISAREKNADTNYIFRLPQMAPSQQTLERYANAQNTECTHHDISHTYMHPSSETMDYQTNVSQGSRTESDYIHITDQAENQTDTYNFPDMQTGQKARVKHESSPTKNVKEFLEEKKDFYDGKFVKINVLYDALCNWLQEKNRHHVNQRILSACIKEEFDIVHKSHRFPDGIHQAYDFTHNDSTDYNFLRFVHENIHKKRNGYFTLQQAKDIYIEQDYCSFKFKYFKEQLESYLDTLCIHKKSINGKMRNSIFLGYDIHTLPRQEKSKHYQIQTHIYEFLDENIVESPGTLLSMRDIVASYKHNCHSYNKRPINELEVERYLCTQLIPEKNVNGIVYKNVFEGYQLKNHIYSNQYMQKSDVMMSWISNTLTITNNPKDRVKCSDMYQDFKVFACHDDAGKIDSVTFGKRLKTKTGLESIVFNGCRHYKGVKLNSDDDD